ncbi:hypothetical protein [Actinophytocola sp.]|uniref:hypothetical protein n=1 Tax=Actinophytocola sp. TaxID=1872138 RepID=UPI002D7F8A86|nr:hypothetical protein [Actinophytocola sp.]HET9138760.1 hypothetical protein [Actinophytocola sp.]
MTYEPPGPPYPPGPGQPPAASPFAGSERPRKNRRWTFVLAGLGVLLLLCCGGTIVLGLVAEDGTKVAAPSSAPTSSSGKVAAPPTTAAAPNRTDPVAKPRTQAPQPPPAPKPAKITYRSLTDREWKKIAKNPDSYSDKGYVVYGIVTQFDAATGPDMFLANVGARNMTEAYEYDTNTVLTGSGQMFDNLVEDDEFRAKVIVIGSYSYDTQIGGSTTVPQLEVRSVTVL